MKRLVLLAIISLAAGMTACAVTQEQQDPLAAQRAEAAQVGAELRQSLAQVPPAPEPLPEATPDPVGKFRTWSGFVLIGNDSDGTQAIALPVDDDGVITNATLDAGEKLTRIAIEGGWRFPVPNSAIFQEVRVSASGRVVGFMALDMDETEAEYAGTEVIVEAVRARIDGGMRLYIHGLCGDLYKLVADRAIGCNGDGCAKLFEPCKANNSL